MRALLDVNVLIALHDQDLVHHAGAASWLSQNGCLRIMAQPAYPGAQLLPVLTAMLQRSTASL